MRRGEAHDQLGSTKVPYWMVVTLVTGFALYAGLYGELTLWLQAVPVALAALVAALAPRSWRGWVTALFVALHMVYVCWLRTYGGYKDAPLKGQEDLQGAVCGRS